MNQRDWPIGISGYFSTFLLCKDNMLMTVINWWKMRCNKYMDNKVERSYSAHLQKKSWGNTCLFGRFSEEISIFVNTSDYLFCHFVSHPSKHRTTLMFTPSPHNTVCTGHVCSVAQLCPTLCDPKDCNLPGSSVHRIVQTRILEWVAISFSRLSSQLRDKNWHLLCLLHCIIFFTTEAPGKPLVRICK